MSEEEKHFERSQIGHDANDLHKHGGLEEDAQEDKTERENLEEAIEALDESDDVEEIKEDVSRPEEEKADLIEEEDDDREAIVAPAEDWKKKEENQPYMTVDEVIEPKAKKKGGLGWKISTFLFLIIAIAGCGAAAYLFFSNGKTEFLGRRVTSESTDKKEQTSNTGKSGGEVADVVKANRVILLDGYDLAIKVPDTLQYLSFDFHYFNEGGCPECTWSSAYSTLDVNAAYTKEDAQAAPEFTSLYDGNLISLGSIVITKSLPQNNDVIGDPTITIETGDPDIKYYVYYDHPQQNVCLEELGLGHCAEWENQTIEAIEAMLTNKDNYIKTK